MREFDLNIERVLENWTVAHALREVIANALDEQALTGTQEPQIFQDAEGRWHVRDWGRGLRYEHLTQNENKEKLTQPDKVVGKFGVGLKDALATFDRHKVSTSGAPGTTKPNGSTLACTPASSSTLAARSSSSPRSSSRTQPNSSNEPGMTGTRSLSCPKQSVGNSPACATQSVTPYATWTVTATSGRAASTSPSILLANRARRSRH
jgi:hypothetical protein